MAGQSLVCILQVVYAQLTLKGLMLMGCSTFQVKPNHILDCMQWFYFLKEQYLNKFNLIIFQINSLVTNEVEPKRH